MYPDASISKTKQVDCVVLRDAADVQFKSGDFEGAERKYRELLRQTPLNAELYNSIATILDIQGRYQEAIAHYNKAILLNPLLSVARYNLANTLRRTGDDNGALETLQQVTNENCEFIEAWKSLAMIYVSREDFAKAASCFRKIVELAPDDIESRCALGNMCSEVGLFTEAVACFETVLKVKPDHISALESLGSALHELDELDRAEECLRKVLGLAPGKVSALNNLGTVLRSKGKPKDAITIFDYALTLDSSNGQVRFNRAMSRLALEELPQAWEDYEARFDTRIPTRLYHPELPRWRGEPLNGRGLLVQSEQGFGDTFQFFRYLYLLADAGGPVVFECQNQSVREALVGLEGINIITRGEPLPTVSLQIPLASLPRLFGTTLDNIPFANGYIKADAKRVAEWRERLFGDIGKLKVGLVWGGNKYSLNANRSMQFVDLEPVLKITNIRFYSLQVGEDVVQLSTLTHNVTDLGAHIRDFGDTAAIIANLDLVITIDTSVAHLAGALGACTWVMLKYSPDWRWFLERSDSPWYSNTKLFRQPNPGDWAGVAKNVSVELAAVSEKKSKV
jgi:Flp pilus assembly protein TadD